MADAVDLIVEQWREERPDLADALETVEVLGRVQRMQRVHDRHFRRLCDEYGLGAGEFDLLSTLRRSGPPHSLTAGAFLKAAMVTAGAVTNRLDHLETKGLVERVRPDSDRRTVQIRLTDAGRELIDEAFAAHLKGYEEILAVLDPDERRHLASGLRRILEAQGDVALG